MLPFEQTLGQCGNERHAMINFEQITDLSLGNLARFDDIIDVRSPAEFLEDHIPGAINLPVLDNEQRAEVGRTYVRESRFLARRMGAAMVSQNISRHLTEELTDKPANYRPLVYCWRGGMRSNAMGTIFSAIGWRTGIVSGGYKSWRREVVGALIDEKSDLKVLLIDGQTGAAKTDILLHAAQIGMQTLDLEGLASHRGSVFGSFPNRTQPAQKMFESQIWRQIAQFDREKPILIEAESNRIGGCFVPERLWRSMQAAPRVEICADPQVRARHLVKAYGDMIDNPEILCRGINRLRTYHSKAQLETWLQMAEGKAFEELACSLIKDHYDAVYNRTRKRRTQIDRKSIVLEDLEPPSLNRAASQIAEIAEAMV